MEQVVELKITKDMLIGDIISKYPFCIETLIGFGVQCVGCHASYEETLEQGFLGHGFTPEKINEAVEQLNQVVDQALSNKGEILAITEGAAEKLKTLMKNNNKEGYGLRIDVIPGGCAGMSYDFDFQEKNSDDQLVIKDKNVKIFISKDQENFFKGSVLEYVDSFQGAGFRIKNNNVKASCACGTSFS